ncbi:MAG: NADH-quinone oxidoreductase subunit B family protein [Armatimonadota bacterium]|nr:NADH-quinone oxidoreductase subunit B family protein [Armatimonadota bacterium]MDR7448990.1 NADH-quinone oxidoreductase subunit B family protein [Armatimonadota bacterium]MDR7458634.1 NADH-quinone oxidoreductase subunit B family protein [Armatimonadota bacterium]MDR7479543.1 NADH-quinone oxidoreductase subunit B family protein [Armatimonadota bacterium]MDR7489313.1 NADH-quinone oxidoreductase subunit B family protein [Armatimonadota bacterium]
MADAPPEMERTPPAVRPSGLAPLDRLIEVVDVLPGGSVLLTSVEAVLNWGRAASLWPLTFGLACCAIEMMAAFAGRFDFDRIGVIPRATPRQADLILVSGRATIKMAPIIRRLWEQMPEPKYVISMGSCATCGGPFYYDNYSILKGVDTVIPVDVYVPGCPPRPEALYEGVLKLQEKIRREPFLRRRAGLAAPAG